MTILEDGKHHQVTAEEAFLKKLLKDSLDKKDASALDMIDLLDRAKAAVPPPLPEVNFTVTLVAPGSVSAAADILRIGRKLDRYRETVHLKLEPWIVGEALARFGDRRLSVEEQRKVVGMTRTPHKVRWPTWWEVKPRSTRKK